MGEWVCAHVCVRVCVWWEEIEWEKEREEKNYGLDCPLPIYVFFFLSLSLSLSLSLTHTHTHTHTYTHSLSIPDSSTVHLSFSLLFLTLSSLLSSSHNLSLSLLSPSHYLSPLSHTHTCIPLHEFSTKSKNIKTVLFKNLIWGKRSKTIYRNSKFKMFDLSYNFFLYFSFSNIWLNIECYSSNRNWIARKVNLNFKLRILTR